MKRIILLSMLTLLVSTFACQNVNAQDIVSTEFNDNGHTVAKGEVVWEGSTLQQAVEASQNGYVYLYNVNTGLFLNAGGTYGVHAMLSTVGMRFQVVQMTSGGNTVYQIRGRIDNRDNTNFGDCLSPWTATSNEVYLDRHRTQSTAGNNASLPFWTFPAHSASSGARTIQVRGQSQNVTLTSYIIHNNYNRNNYGNYLGTNGANSSSCYMVGQNGNNNVWRFVTENDYKKAMDNVTWGTVDLGSFLKDAEFGRDNKDGRYWVWSIEGTPTVPISIGTHTDSEGQTVTDDAYEVTGSTPHWHQRNQDIMSNGYVLGNSNAHNNVAGTNVPGSGNYTHDQFRSNFAQYYAAEIYNEKITLSQQVEMSGVENLTEGLYKLTAQAFYYDDGTGLTNQLSTNPDLSNAYFFIKTETDGNVTTQALPIIPMNRVSNAIMPHSGISAGYVFDNNANAYLLEFFVELKQSTKLTIGMRTEEAKGWTVFGNVHLYAHGKQVLLVDENWIETSRIPLYDSTTQSEGTLTPVGTSPYKAATFIDGYDFPATVYYRRTMTKNAWNTICLPVDLTGSQVRATFGADCKLSEFQGMDGVDASTIRFKKVDLDASGTVMTAGKAYIIWPTREPDLTSGKQRVVVGNGAGDVHYVEVEAPNYFIAGVTRSEALEDGVPALIESTCPNTSLVFKGNFYKFQLKGTNDGGNDIYGTNNPNGAYHYWVINKGTMYHLTGLQSWNIWATYAYIYDPQGTFKDASSGVKSLSVEIDDDIYPVTDIEGIGIATDVTFENSAVYNLSGQKLNGTGSIDNLPKGIYIVNGHKYVVR